MITENLSQFNSALAQYMALRKETPDEILEKKGRDLSIRLFRGFSAHKWGGNGGNRAGLARSELSARTAAGKGTRVRKSLLAEYSEKRIALAQARLPLLAQKRAGTLDKKSRTQLRKNLARRSNLWRSTVGKETALRQRGIGVLGASFLSFRSRTSRDRGRFYVRNKRGRRFGYVEKGQGFIRIVGLTEGLDQVSARYGIANEALAGSAQDMRQYIYRKDNEAFARAFSGIPKASA